MISTPPPWGTGKIAISTMIFRNICRLLSNKVDFFGVKEENSTMPNQVEYLLLNEINALLNSIEDERDRAIVILFLNTGIFLNELAGLKINSINWEKKILSIPGGRKRNITLNDQAYEALARWSKDRPDSRATALFVTTKGKPKELSSRMVDHLIRKYAEEAGIKKKVNAQMLRNTFAVKLFTEEPSTEKAAAILGITDPESINRYQRASKLPPPKAGDLTSEALSKMDTRPKLAKSFSKIFPTKPKIARPVTEIKGPIIPNPEEVIFGREKVVEEIKSELNKSQPVLLLGQLGIGKTHVLKHINKILAPKVIYISSPTPLKNMLGQICDKINPDWKKQVKTRASTKELVDYLLKIKGPRPPILIIDNLNQLKLSDVDVFISLLDNFTILGAANDANPKLKQIWWKFKRIELRPLHDTSAKELVKYLTQNLAVSDYELLETRVLSLSNGLPLAIVDMVHQVSHKHVVNREAIREVYHEAGIHYRDWTYALVVLWGLAIMFRFIALGTHSFESYILAGFGIAFLSIMRFFVFRMR